MLDTDSADNHQDIAKSKLPSIVGISKYHQFKSTTVPRIVPQRLDTTKLLLSFDRSTYPFPAGFLE